MGNLPLEREWDILLVFDACRYDYFEKCNPYPGKLSEYDISCNGTVKYFHLLFDNQDCSDIVFINHIFLFSDWFNIDNFHKVINAYDTHWSEEYGTILPEGNTELGLKAIRENPGKRVIVHYVQPHLPYLDRPHKLVKRRTERQLAYKNPIEGTIASTLNKCKNIFPAQPFWAIEKLFGSSAGIGEVYFKEGFEGLRKSYEYNLRRALNSAKPIIDKYRKDKTIVMTADHGKVLGEHCGLFSHGWYKFKEVTTVPWFIVDGD
jgi:hypothetical protein